MAEGGQRYEFGRLILDYLRTFMWPVVIVAFAIFYFEDVVELIRGREVKVLGVEIGPAVAQLQETTEQELTDLQALVADLRANYRRELEAANTRGEVEGAVAAPVSEETQEAAQAVETKLSSLRANLDREAQALREATAQQALPQQTALPPDPPSSAVAATRADEAAAFERAGFEAILERRLDDAIEAFERARAVWPDYHNVDEIAAYLSEVRATEAPLDAASWAAIDRIILTRYSWGMPAHLRDAFRARVTA
jgi:tetratricopeptide (TPR) repeat protein